MSVFGQREAADRFARNQSRQPTLVLFRRSKRMNRVNGKRALDRGQRTQTRIAALELLHHQSERGVTHPRATVLLQIRRKKS